MAGLKHIKAKIRSVEKTRKVTKAMEAVSAAKMRKAQQKALAGRAYARAAVSILARVSGAREHIAHPLMQNREVRRALYIVITADRGLAGALNSSVLRMAEHEFSTNNRAHEQIAIIAVGRKAYEYFLRRDYTIEAHHPNTGESISPELIYDVVSEASERFSAGLYDEVKIIYQHFVTTFEQRATVRTILPLSLDALREIVDDIIPARGKYSEDRREAAVFGESSVYMVEPSPEIILREILPRLAGVFVYHALLESQASEHSARMVAMKNASDKGKDLQHSLALKYNKARQAAITREVSEITGGMEAMAA